MPLCISNQLPVVESGNKFVQVQETKAPIHESIYSAYFAKKEYTKRSTKAGKSHTYRFKNDNKNINKKNVASIIYNNIAPTLKENRLYTKVELIERTLTKDSYDAGEKLAIPTYKLEPMYKPVDSASLGGQVYLVAKASQLDGKELTFTLKDKSGTIKAADGALEALQLAHEDDEEGTQQTQFKVTIEEGKATIPIKLRPQSDKALDDWNEKIKAHNSESLLLYLEASAQGEEEQHTESSEGFQVTNQSNWHDPVDNPRLTKYNYGGIIKPSSGTFGECRRRTNGSKKYHGGFDFFAIPGKDKVYSCLKGNIVEVRFSNQAGWVVRIKVQNAKGLLDQEKKVNYQLQYKDEWKGRDITLNDDVYLIYMHLHSAFFTEEDAKNNKEVDAGTPLGLAGVSGTVASGSRAPHLHMEIATVRNPYSEGREYRTNPARFVKLNSYDTIDQDTASKLKHKHNLK